MKITVSRWELFSHHLQEEIELNNELIEDVLEWSDGVDIENYTDFFAVLPEYFKDYDIDDPKIKEIEDIGGDYYPGSDDHDWNHVTLDEGEATDSEKAMITEAIARFKQPAK